MTSKLWKSMKIFVSKVTIVTRSSRGIGKSIAYELAINVTDQKLKFPKPQFYLLK